METIKENPNLSKSAESSVANKTPIETSLKDVSSKEVDTPITKKDITSDKIHTNWVSKLVETGKKIWTEVKPYAKDVINRAIRVGVSNLTGSPVFGEVAARIADRIGLCEGHVEDVEFATLINQIILNTSRFDVEDTAPDSWNEFNQYLKSLRFDIIMRNKTTYTHYDALDLLCCISHIRGPYYNSDTNNYVNVDYTELFNRVDVANDSVIPNYFIANYAANVKTLFVGADPGPILGTFRSNIDNYDVQNIMRTLTITGNVEAFRFSACTPLLKIFLYANQIMPAMGDEMYGILSNIHSIYNGVVAADIERWPFDATHAGGPVVVRGGVIQMDAYLRMIGNTQPDDAAGWLTINFSQTAIVPINTSMLRDSYALLWWILMFMEYPYRRYALQRYFYVDDAGFSLANNAGIRYEPVDMYDFTLAANTKIDGPVTRFLIVITDSISTSVPGAVQISLDNIIPGLNIMEYGAVGFAAVDFGPALDNAILQLNRPSLLNICISNWMHLFGSIDDWREATLAAAKLCYRKPFDPMTVGDGVIPRALDWHYVINHRPGAPAFDTVNVANVINYLANTQNTNQNLIRPKGFWNLCPMYTAFGTNYVEMRGNLIANYNIPLYSRALGPIMASKIVQPVNALPFLSCNAMQAVFSIKKTAMYTFCYFSKEIVQIGMGHFNLLPAAPHLIEQQLIMSTLQPNLRHETSVLFGVTGGPLYHMNLDTMRIEGGHYPENIAEEDLFVVTGNRCPISTMYKLSVPHALSKVTNFNKDHFAYTTKDHVFHGGNVAQITIDMTNDHNDVNWDCIQNSVNHQNTNNPASLLGNIIYTYEGAGWYSDMHRHYIEPSFLRGEFRLIGVVGNIDLTLRPKLCDGMQGLINSRYLNGALRLLQYGFKIPYTIISECEWRVPDPVLCEGNVQQALRTIDNRNIVNNDNIFTFRGSRKH